MKVFTRILRIFLLMAILETVQFSSGSKSQYRGKAMSYLSKFGYLPGATNNKMIDKTTLSEAIENFQRFVGLEVTGTLDKATIKEMSKPRCGVRDKIMTTKRTKRFALHVSTWDHYDLKYKILSYPFTLEKNVVDDIIERAFSMWSEVTKLTFKREEYGQVDIEIGGDHHDFDPFDGPSHTLAHAFFPVFGGDVHFDYDEEWSTGETGYNLLQIAVHEIGHTLGLLHSDESDAVMAPIFAYKEEFKLHIDDIQAIQKLYGVKENDASQQKLKEYSICDDLRVDTIFTDADGYIYIFRYDRYYRTKRISSDKYEPKYISERWPGLPANIDAAFAIKSKTYFFKGSKYWVFIGRQLVAGYPKLIRHGFLGIPDNLDACTLGPFGSVFFFRSNQFWTYKDLSMATNESQNIREWIKDIPTNLDAAWSTGKGYTCFFKGDQIYCLNDNTYEIVNSTLSSLFKCNQ